MAFGPTLTPSLAHSFDIPIISGASGLRGPDTALEAETSKYYQAAWVSFAKDPRNALKQFGWPLYDPDQNTLVELGFEGNVSAIFGLGDEFDRGAERNFALCVMLMDIYW